MGKTFLTVMWLIIFKARYCALNLDIALIPTMTPPSDKDGFVVRIMSKDS
jgi:hypothetical protein